MAFMFLLFNIMKYNVFLLKKNIVLIILLGFFSIPVKSQTNSHKGQSQFWEHVRFGGGLGLGFGDGYFSGTIAPSAIYQFDDTFALGVGLNASYYKQKNIHKSTILGGSLIGLFNPSDFLQLSAEFEEQHVSRNFDQNYVGNPDTNYWYPALFLGAGYRTGNFAFGIRYDVLYDDDKSIFADPWMPFVRVYF